MQESDVFGIASKAEITYATNENDDIIGPLTIGKLLSGKSYSPSKHIPEVIRCEIKKAESDKNKRKRSNDEESTDTVDTTESDYILNALPESVLSALDKDALTEIKRIQSTIKDHIQGHGFESNVDLVGVAEIFEEHEENISPEPYFSSDGGKTPADSEQNPEMGHDMEQSVVEQEQGITPNDNVKERFVLTEEDFSCMLMKLNESIDASRWVNCSRELFIKQFESISIIYKAFKKRELQLCFKAVSPKLKESNITHACSWPKYKISKLFSDIMNANTSLEVTNPKARRGTGKTLKRLCRNVVSSIPKVALNAIHAEHVFPDRLEAWKQDNPFQDSSSVTGVIIYEWTFRKDKTRN